MMRWYWRDRESFRAAIVLGRRPHHSRGVLHVARVVARSATGG